MSGSEACIDLRAKRGFENDIVEINLLLEDSDGFAKDINPFYDSLNDRLGRHGADFMAQAEFDIVNTMRLALRNK